jgi:hypothetical protein
MRCALKVTGRLLRGADLPSDKLVASKSVYEQFHHLSLFTGENRILEEW